MPSFVITESLGSKPHYTKKQRAWMCKESKEYKRNSFEKLKRQFAKARQ